MRGALGNILRKICCCGNSLPVATNKDCFQCILSDNCPFSILFDSTPPKNSKILSKFTDIPRPFVLEPPLESNVVYPPGSELKFNLILIGRAIEYLPYFIVGFTELGEIGIGKGRGRFQLKKVSAIPYEPGKNGKQDFLVYDPNSRRINLHPQMQISGDQILAKSSMVGEDGLLAINFVTMTRLTHEGRLVDRPEFSILIRSVVRRAFALLAFFHDLMPEIDFARIYRVTESVQLAEDKTNWEDWERYSSRQQTRMKLGGIVGSATYESKPEVLAELLPWVHLAELIHVGKGATFGLGKIEIA